MKHVYYLLRLLLIVFSLNSTFAMVIDGRFGKHVSAGESEYAYDLSSKIHSSERYKPGFFDHEHLFDFKRRETLTAKGLTYELVSTDDFVTNHSGGLKRAGSDIDTSISWMTNNDLMLEFDTGLAGLWKNGTFFSHIFYHMEILVRTMVDYVRACPPKMDLYHLMSWFTIMAM
ncbi:MAG: hypothetical protein QGH40_17195 [bacterium]|nr:hypothetical protein [bacterium]